MNQYWESNKKGILKKNKRYLKLRALKEYQKIKLKKFLNKVGYWFSMNWLLKILLLTKLSKKMDLNLIESIK